MHDMQNALQHVNECKYENAIEFVPQSFGQRQEKKVIWDKQNPVDWRRNKEHTVRELNLSTAKPRSFSFS